MKALIIGGNRFFGRHLAMELLAEGIEVTLLNRGRLDDGIGERVKRIVADRNDNSAMRSALSGPVWDLVFDQVCYTAEEARNACALFEGKTKRFVLTSTESVYDNGENQSEGNFVASGHTFTVDADRYKDYQGAKRQTEAIFSRHARFETVVVRPSLVVGIDDYTQRLSWHIDRIRAGLPIYFPDINIKSDFIRSDQTAQAIKIIGLSKVTGPVNCTTRGAICLQELVAMCEKATGKKANLTDQPNSENHSPYGGTGTKTMNTDLLYSMGFNAPSSRDWMEGLVRELA